MPGVAGAAAIGGAIQIGSGLLASESARKASNAQQFQQQQAIAAQEARFAETQANLQPFIQAGQVGIQGLQQAGTAQGLDQRLGDIFSGSTFQNLLGERTRAAQGGLAAAGLTRSGAGLQAIANVPQGLGLQLEGILAQRQGTLAGLGQTTAAQLGGLGQSNVNQISGLLENIGQTQSQGILGQGQADAARNAALLQGLGSLAGAGIGFATQGPSQASQAQIADVGGQVAGGFIPGGALAGRIPGAAAPAVFPVG
jgi:hypothetical protein